MKSFPQAFRLLIFFSLFIAACTGAEIDTDLQPDSGSQPQIPGGGGGTAADDSSEPDFDYVIAEWSGELADDAADDVVGSDADIYYELNDFSNVVTVTYDGDEATVETDVEGLLYYTSGAYVSIDMQTGGVTSVEIVLKGHSDDGGLKIYGSKKFKLTLDGVSLKSGKGPAINSQCKKRVFVHLAEGTVNELTDVADYQDDDYYLDETLAADEDRKGCFFSEGNMIFSGTGVLKVAGLYKHGIVTDGYLVTRPGTNLVVTQAAKNAVHVKGDADDGIGVKVLGGMIYANAASEAGKGIKTDLDVEVLGGQLFLNTSGEAVYDADDQDTSSSACIKTDGSIKVSGGTLVLKSSGTGGKGLNADGDIVISGGETTITTTGGKYYYTEDLTSSPKGAKADGNVTVSGGKLSIAVTGVSDGSEGLESKSVMTISGGEVYVYAYDDAINASSAINISGGRVYAYAVNNDGIDSNGTLAITGGVVVATGTSAPESGIDVDNSSWFTVDGGTVISLGGSLQSNPSSSSKQRSVVYNGLTTVQGEMLTLLDENSEPVLSFEFTRGMSGATLMISSPGIVAGGEYGIWTGGELTQWTEAWNGWYDGGVWSGGEELGSFTASSVVSTLGQGAGSGGPGGMPSGPGGRPW